LRQLDSGGDASAREQHADSNGVGIGHGAVLAQVGRAVKVELENILPRGLTARRAFT